MIDLNRAFETENGIKVEGVIVPQSVVSVIRSSKPTFTGDLITSIEYFNSLTQVNANRILKCDFTYSGDNIATQVNTYYQSNGTTVHQVENIAYSYTADLITNIEVS
jgi:hypothetical protein